LKFLADMGVSELTVVTLRDRSHDVVHARDQARIVITFDLDFGDLLAAAGEKLPSVILVRTRN